ncbi:unnamed protein product [Calypogeia fissa]
MSGPAPARKAAPGFPVTARSPHLTAAGRWGEGPGEKGGSGPSRGGGTDGTTTTSFSGAEMQSEILNFEDRARVVGAENGGLVGGFDYLVRFVVLFLSAEERAAGVVVVRHNKKGAERERKERKVTRTILPGRMDETRFARRGLIITHGMIS